MFLETVGLKNFRSFEDEQICFSDDLTILVGENNGGKSNAIDAIRLITTPLSGRREIYCESTDVRFGSTDRKFELDATFASLNISQQGRLISAVTDHSLNKAVFGITYDETRRSHPVRPTSWAGHLKSSPEAGCQECIRHVYLPPLRDAKRALASGNPTRIYSLLRHFLGEDDPQQLADRLKRNTDEKILKDIGGAVDIGLTALTAGVRRQSASLGFSTDEALIDIARDLRFKLADHGIEPEDLRYTGHGYANLLYMATIAVELEKVNDTDLTLFLVEEPEAHLHPQLQAAVLCFLEEQAEKSKVVLPGYLGPAGQLQVIVATHSPNLSAWVSSKNIVFFRSVVTVSRNAVPIPPPTEAEVTLLASAIAEANTDIPIATMTEGIGELVSSPIGDEEDSGQAAGFVEDAVDPVVEPSLPPPLSRRSTRCIPLKKLALPDFERRKVDRYLDVTKSAFLFGGRVLLVEGIAETLLLPVIAKKYVLAGKPEKLRLFRSAVFVPIDGVDFECYQRLLLTPYNDIRIADQVVVVTDGDRKSEAPGVASAGQLRKIALDTVATELVATELFRAVINTYSLETELVSAGNGELLKQVYLKLHPRSETKWDTAAALSGDAQAASIQGLFEDTRKGDFAHLLAEAINSAATFVVPAYIREAIEALVQ
ncbi:putative ATP-dependent endonuclease of the OLD family [Granulicella rosea]|uniref:Putative ATP-dependent endonuclease of the OLD family n=1 Tax=Granulicella rosea TaxID=474952 RepID=A0A239GMN4_9BACT|nr:AAA family ATPase [Granulicella rosea]SNS70536.1 putative ATP-dependent endonuclease of the OLD family [Granulicella rosea]